MQCLLCGRKIPVFKKLASSGFCSDAHRKAYAEEQNRLAIDRLAAALQPARQAPASIQIPPEIEPTLAGCLVDYPRALGQTESRARAVEFQVHCSEVQLPNPHIPVIGCSFGLASYALIGWRSELAAAGRVATWGLQNKLAGFPQSRLVKKRMQLRFRGPQIAAAGFIRPRFATTVECAIRLEGCWTPFHAQLIPRGPSATRAQLACAPLVVMFAPVSTVKLEVRATWLTRLQTDIPGHLARLSEPNLRPAGVWLVGPLREKPIAARAAVTGGREMPMKVQLPIFAACLYAKLRPGNARSTGIQAYKTAADRVMEAEPMSFAFACRRRIETLLVESRIQQADLRLCGLRQVSATPRNAGPTPKQEANLSWQLLMPQLPRLRLPVITPARRASKPFRGVIRLWRSAPALARGAVLVIPLCAGMILFAPSFQSARLRSSIGQALHNRATIDLREDFRFGLLDWEGPDDWAKDWTYDRAGFLRPGKLALFRPSLALRDYQFEFLGQIERKSLSWVFRAPDTRNYYVTKIAIAKPGPLPGVVLQRYAVLDGRVQDRKQFPLPLTVRSDTIYQVRVVVAGTQFTTAVNGVIVDTWSDGHLPRGGIGFFTDSGEAWRLRWVRLTDRDDFLGRICAYLLAKTAAYRGAGTSE